MYLKLTEIQSLANKLMLPFDIADIIEVNRYHFIKELNDNDSAVRKAFYKGFLSREVEIKSAIYPSNDIEELQELENIPDVFDADMAQLQLRELKEFKAKLTIQLYA